MNQKTVILVIVTAVITLIVAPKLRQLPGVSQLPTV